MASPWRHPEFGIYYFRRAVPHRLRPAIGKTMLKISLETKDPAVARSRFGEYASAVEAEWSRLDAALIGQAVATPMIRLRQEEVVALAGELYQDLMRLHGPDPGSAASWREKLRLLQRALPLDHRLPDAPSLFPGGPMGIALYAGRLLSSEVSALLATKNLRIDPTSRRKLDMEAAKAVAQAYRELIKRATGDYRPDPYRERFPVLASFGPSRSTPWHEVYGAYQASAEPSPATVKRQTGVLKAFFAFLGHEDLAAVTKADAERWIAHREQVVSARTVRDADMAHPKTLCLFAKRKGIININPFEDIRVNVRKTETLRDREFDQDEAEAILRASLEVPGPRMTEEGKAARRWVPWICAYTGARVNEITQARASDVLRRKSQNGDLVWCIKITPEAGTVKTGKARVVALHPHVIEQGFLEYVASRKGKHLFYDPARSRGGSRANPQYKKVGERLAQWVRGTVGITDPGVDPNHGWRHLFRSALLAAGVQEQVINRIDGHAGKTVGQTYGTAWPQVMFEAISKIPPYRVGAEGDFK